MKHDESYGANDSPGFSEYGAFAFGMLVGAGLVIAILEAFVSFLVFLFRRIFG